jgi:hypothetical protein
MFILDPTFSIPVPVAKKGRNPDLDPQQRILVGNFYLTNFYYRKLSEKACSIGISALFISFGEARDTWYVGV